MKYIVDVYATFLITIEVEGDSYSEAKDAVFMEDLNAIAAKRIRNDNGLPELEFEIADVCEEF